MKVVVTGAKGMLGSDVVRQLGAADIELVALDEHDCDITDRAQVQLLMDQHTPTHLINCAAYTDVDGAETESELCWQINVVGVQNLLEACQTQHTHLLQISTDYVFDGTCPAYDEMAVRNPINTYGESKAAAEALLTPFLDQHYIVRTSWLFGTHGKNFVGTMQRLATEKDSLMVVDDQIGSPTYTVDAADALVRILEHDPGIYHISNSGSCSWFAFAQEIMRQINASCVINSCSSQEYEQVAKRPQYSILENTKLPALRPWTEALQAYLSET